MGRNSPQQDMECRNPLTPSQRPGFPLVLCRDSAQLAATKEMLSTDVVVAGRGCNKQHQILPGCLHCLHHLRYLFLLFARMWSYFHFYHPRLVDITAPCQGSQPFCLAFRSFAVCFHVCPGRVLGAHLSVLRDTAQQAAVDRTASLLPAPTSHPTVASLLRRMLLAGFPQRCDGWEDARSE